jgi:hypothetical protein
VDAVVDRDRPDHYAVNLGGRTVTSRRTHRHRCDWNVARPAIPA